MPNPTFVWCTESVDTSAVQLAQYLDAECTKVLTDEMDTAKDNIIFYGNVALDDMVFNKNNMFNDPSIGHAIRNKKTFLERLVASSNNGVTSPKLTVVNETATFTKCQQLLGTTGKLDMLEKGTMKILGTVENAVQFNAFKASSGYACKHTNTVKKMRVFFGIQEVLGHSVLGVSFTEYRTLTFKETLKMGRSAEVQAQVDDMFEKGLLTEASGAGMTAWTDVVNYEHGNEFLNTVFTNNVKNIINNVYTTMRTMFNNIDFFAVDVSVDSNGNAFVTNVTTSPSLQNIDILTFVANYFKHLLSFGRISLKKKLTTKIETLSLERIKKVLDLLDAEEQAA